MRLAAVLGILVSVATALCPLKTCFDHDGGAAAPAAPGEHGHDDHQGPDRDSGCCVDVPKETGGPWVVVHIDLPQVRCGEPGPGPRTPTASESIDAPRVAPVRPTVLLR